MDLVRIWPISDWERREQCSRRPSLVFFVIYNVPYAGEGKTVVGTVDHDFLSPPVSARAINLFS